MSRGCPIRPSGILLDRRVVHLLDLQHRLGHRRPHERRGDRVDADAVGRPVDRLAAGHRGDRALRRRVDDLVGQRQERRLRREVHDRPAPAGLHVPERRLGAEQAALHVHPPEAVEVRLGRLLHRHVLADDRRAVHEAVDAPQLGDDAIERGEHRVAVADVDADRAAPGDLPPPRARPSPPPPPRRDPRPPRPPRRPPLPRATPWPIPCAPPVTTTTRPSRLNETLKSDIELPCCLAAARVP